MAWSRALLSAFACLTLGALNSASAQQHTCVNMNIAGTYAGSTFDPGVDDLGIHCDDCTAAVTFPFPVRLYGVTYTSAVVSSNGNVQFSGASVQYLDETLPTGNMGTAVFPLWDDLTTLDPGDGVFTSTTGVAPDRVFNIEWRAHYLGQPGAANFEVRFFENSRNFEFVYGAYDTYALQTYVIGVQQGGSGMARNAAHGSAAYPPGTRFVFTETYTGSRGQFSGPFPAGITDIGNHCDDCTTPIALPFPVEFYGQTFTSANVSSNGNLQFVSNNSDFDNTCLPVPGFGPTIFAHWDDLLTTGVGEGVFTNTTGTAPFRIFDINWRAHYFNNAGSVNFTVRFLEGMETIETFFLTSDQHGNSATLGVQAGDERYGEQWCNAVNAANAGNIYILSLPPIAVRGYGGNVPVCATDIGNHCDDCTTTIALPFTVSLFGQQFTSAAISSNGNVQFTSNSTDFNNTCLPAAGFGTTIFGHWDDLRTDTQGSGIYTTTFFGSAPNRAFGIEWRATSFATGAPVHFEVVLYEHTPRFQVYYDIFPDNGSATAGVQNGSGPEVFTHFCNATGRFPVSVDYLCLGPPCESAIADQPASATTCPIASTTFFVTPQPATTGGPFTFQWQWRPATPAAGPFEDVIAGANTLPGTSQSIFSAAGPQAQSMVWDWEVEAEVFSAELRCIISNACGSATSDIAVMTLCKADFDCDGAINVQDIFGFLSAWFAGTPTADFNSTGGINVQDIFDFLSAWFAGC